MRYQKYLRLLGPIAVIAIAGMVLVGFAAGRQSENTRADDRVENSDAAITFRQDMRKLWEDHVTWTRLTVISIADGLPDQDATVSRLLQNQDDIGDAIKPYYGDAAGERLTALLRDHIVIAADLVVAAEAGDATAAADASARWDANADEIASFLSSANPDAWPESHMQAMVREHLALTLAEAQARLGAHYEADVAAYDAVHDAILEMADMLSLGIIDQFPKRFK